MTILREWTWDEYFNMIKNIKKRLQESVVAARALAEEFEKMGERKQEKDNDGKF